MHHHLSRRLAINPAVDQRLGHHRQRYLDAPEIHEQVGHFALRLAPSAHLRDCLLQNRPPCPIPAHGRGQLAGMRMANKRACLRRGFALLATLAEHLAPPIVAIPGFWYPRHAFRYAHF
jgi:hypothetical protein